MADIKRLDGESFVDYFVRVWENKNIFGMTSQDVADVLNKESGKNFNESTWRKNYAAFRQGREYERNRQTRGVCNRILCLSDFHYPFQLPIETFKDYVGCVDTLVLNGDIFDQYSNSKFLKSYRIDFMDELVGCRQYIIDLIEYVHPKSVYFTVGNHEKRMQSYINKNIDNEMKELMPDTVLDLVVEDGFYHYNKRERSKSYYEPIKNLFPGINIYFDGKYYAQVGKTIFIHPSSYSSGMLKTAEKAVIWAHNGLSTDFDCLVMAHTHKVGSYQQGNITLFEQGCLCKVDEMCYADGKLFNPQQNGFIYIAQDCDGNLLYDKSKVVRL